MTKRKPCWSCLLPSVVCQWSNWHWSMWSTWMVRSNDNWAPLLAPNYWCPYSIFWVCRHYSKRRIVYRRPNAQTRAICFERSPSLSVVCMSCSQCVFKRVCSCAACPNWLVDRCVCSRRSSCCVSKLTPLTLWFGVLWVLKSGRMFEFNVQLVFVMGESMFLREFYWKNRENRSFPMKSEYFMHFSWFIHVIYPLFIIFWYIQRIKLCSPSASHNQLHAEQPKNTGKPLRPCI